MGFRYRKSVNLGLGFRVNFSKSGIGYSWGTKGYRKTKQANGKVRTTHSIPGTGLSYTETNGGNSKKNKKNKGISVNQSNSSAVQANIDNNLHLNVESNVSNSNQEELLQNLAKRAKIDALVPIILIVLVVVSCFIWPLIFLALLYLIFYFFYFAVFRKKHAVQVSYKFDEETQSQYNKFTSIFSELNTSNKIWLIPQTQSLASLNQRKASGGAQSLVKRQNVKPFKLIKSGKFVFGLKTDVKTINLKAGAAQILFLPDIILVKKGMKLSGISYENVKVTIDTIGFIEDSFSPKDAEMIRQTWKYVNKNGSADKRVKNNKKLPVMKYGQITISSHPNLFVQYMVSNSKVIEPVKQSLMEYGDYIENIKTGKNKMLETQETQKIEVDKLTNEIDELLK